MPTRTIPATLRKDGKRKQGLSYLRRSGLISGLSSGQQPARWTGENTAGKISLRYFKTPYQEKYKNGNTTCWRQCGSTVANHHHIFWACPKLNVFWKGIQDSLSGVFNTQIPLSFEALYLGQVPSLTCRRDIKLIQILLVASKKINHEKVVKSAPAHTRRLGWNHP